MSKTSLIQQYDMSKTRLKVLPYPSNKQFKDEANSDNYESWAVLHIEIWHDMLSTCDVFSLIKHDFPPRHLKPTKKLAKLMLTEHLDWVSWVNAGDIELNEKEHNVSGYQPQIDIWFHKVSHYMYDLWIQWCKEMFKRSARWSNGKGGIENPFAGLRFRVRIEFHD